MFENFSQTNPYSDSHGSLLATNEKREKDISNLINAILNNKNIRVEDKDMSYESFIANAYLSGKKGMNEHGFEYNILNDFPSQLEAYANEFGLSEGDVAKIKKEFSDVTFAKDPKLQESYFNLLSHALNIKDIILGDNLVIRKKHNLKNDAYAIKKISENLKIYEGDLKDNIDYLIKTLESNKNYKDMKAPINQDIVKVIESIYKKGETLRDDYKTERINTS